MALAGHAQGDPLKASPPVLVGMLSRIAQLTRVPLAVNGQITYVSPMQNLFVELEEDWFCR